MFHSKKFLFLCCMMAMAAYTVAQTEHSFNLGGKTLSIVEVGRLTIQSHSGANVIIKTEDNSPAKPERAEGLRAINALGLTDNTGIGLSVKESEDQVEVRSVSQMSSTRYVVMVPNNASVKYEQSSVHGESIAVKDFRGELDISVNYGNVKLDQVGGSIAINCVYGNIDAKFGAMTGTDPINLHSVYGHVDVSLPAATKANVRMSTGYGEMFTDFDIVLEKQDDLRKVSSRQINGKINGGGLDIGLKATYSNIYLRKS